MLLTFGSVSSRASENSCTADPGGYHHQQACFAAEEGRCRSHPPPAAPHAAGAFAPPHLQLLPRGAGSGAGDAILVGCFCWKCC